MELVFGHDVRGPLKMVKEHWLKAESDSTKISHHLGRLKQGGHSPGNQGNQGKVREKIFYGKVREKSGNFMKNCQSQGKMNLCTDV